MNEGEEDFVFYGTPIEREEDMSRRKRKIVSEAGQMRNLPAWKQEVTDEEGRRRFHGAFTGGFSAGYYNTVGSKEGWTPQTFTSSRKNRAEMKKQSIYSFLDDDEKAEISGNGLETSSQFDTFGFTAAEFARKQAEKTQEMRPSAIPGPVPDEIVLPAANSIGVKLLLKMGWRHGHSIKSSHTGKLYDARREARKAFLALSGNNGTSETAEVEPDGIDSRDLFERQNGTPVFVLEPKKDLHGLGFDPFKNAPEFRDRNASRVSGKKGLGAKRGLFATNSGKIAPGFGIGALEETGIEDEDVYASEFEFEEPYVEEPEQTLKVNQDSKLRLTDKEQNVILGFKVALDADYIIERFPPPAIPSDFQPYHKFTVSLQASTKPGDLPPPPEAPAPDEKDLKILIDGFASLVSRCGKIYEDLSKEKHKGNPIFSFLYGGNGHDYYIWKLWEEQQKRPDLRPMLKQASSVQKLTAETRGRILGEKPLKRSDDGARPAVQLQYHLADSFTVPSTLAGIPESEKPFRDDPMKQARFEQFLKDKYQGGLRSTSAASGASAMSEEERARERLDFEATAEALSKGKTPTFPSALPSPVAAVHFVSGSREDAAVAVAEKKMSYPKREEFQWRPAPVLCKRFDLIDPFMGKPPPPPRARSKVETLIIMPEILKSKFNEAAADVSRDVPAASQADVPELDSLPQAAVTERPVDLYKAIFSDDEEEDINEEEETLNPIDHPSSSIEPTSEGINSTLNKLIAGDFLQTLGQELGLQVLPDSQPPPFSSRKPPKLGDSSKKKSGEKSTVSKKERNKSSRERSDSESESGHESESRRKRRKSRERRKRSRSRERRSDGHSSRSRSRRRHH